MRFGFISMTCSILTWSPEAAEDDSLRPDLRRVESFEVGLFNDELEGPK